MGSLHYIRELLQSSITQAQNQELNRSPLQVEIKRAVFDLSSTSAPGQDGFGGCFFQVSWEIICHNIYIAVVFFSQRR